jgi:hypothetical protein
VFGRGDDHVLPLRAGRSQPRRRDARLVRRLLRQRDAGAR